MEYGLIIFLYAAIIMLAALAGLSVKKDFLHLTLQVAAWVVTAFQVFYIAMVCGIELLPFIFMCCAVLARLIIEFMIGAIIIGRENGKIDDYYTGKWFGAICLVILLVLLALIVSVVVLLVQSIDVNDIINT